MTVVLVEVVAVDEQHLVGNNNIMKICHYQLIFEVVEVGVVAVVVAVVTRRSQSLLAMTREGTKLWKKTGNNDSNSSVLCVM